MLLLIRNELTLRDKIWMFEEITNKKIIINNNFVVKVD